METNTYLTDKQVAARFTINKSTVWRWVEKGRFPKPVKLSPGCTRWRLPDVEAWETERRAAA
ncbi:helix-turn-helix transcriptional regulator [Marinobacterium weihaiense]|uniref:AlpA family phage regulatory protein n=1 Tax=Marinobacterium weihaiense TaxID=2851016 RepID=A0ABS6M7W5_9GAMM|nr:AlpA family phage regulatory protein [Marinobacterium weihaiense]MBV0932368.1 AlpA family phage regulatory protein [Marinobacterium weihaiense]